MTDLTGLTVVDARERLDRREISAVELVNAHLERIQEIDGQVRSFLTFMDERAVEMARDADAAISAGESGPMTGIPVALKDILCTIDAPTTAASKILEGYVSPYDATVVKRLRDEKAVFVGKTNTDEFAMGSSTENSAFFTTRNPWDLDRVPGGSSGGSAAAVAAREAMVSLDRIQAGASASPQDSVESLE